MKKLLVIGPRAFPADFIGTSGVEAYVEQTLQQLILLRNDIRVTIFTRRKYQQELSSQATVKKIKVKAFWSYPGRVLEAFSYGFVASLAACFQKANVVWYHTAGISLFSWLPALCGKEVWITIHSLDWQRKKWHKLERVIFQSAFALVIKMVPSMKLFAVSEVLCQRLHVTAYRNCQVIHPGVPVPSFSQKNLSKKNYLLYLGRLVPEKRVEWLLKFCQSRNIRCIIAGTHGNTPKYEKMLRKEYACPCIEWYGAAVGTQKWKLLAEASYLVLPSEIEGFPITILEAISVKTPALLAQGILPKDIENLSMIKTFSASSQQNFNNVLTTLLRKKITKVTFSGNDRRTLAHYSWKRTAKAYSLFL